MPSSMTDAETRNRPRLRLTLPILLVVAVAASATLVGNLLASGALDEARARRDAVERSPVFAPMVESPRAIVSRATASDPEGDTFVAGAPFDAVELTATLFGGDTLVVGARFAGPISPPDSGAADALDGFVDLDVDQDPTTGMISWTDSLTGSAPLRMGNEFYLDLFSFDSGAGDADLVDDASNQVAGRVPVDFTADGFSAQIPLALLGDDGLVDVAAVFFQDIAQPIDIVPNEGVVASSEGGGGGILVDTGDTSPCPDDAITLCLNGERFAVTANFTTAQDGTRDAQAAPELTADTGYFWFFEPDNVEMVVKVLEACPVNGFRWVFAGGLTNVQVQMTVRDTETGLARIYSNPQGMAFDPIQDTGAFECQ